MGIFPIYLKMKKSTKALIYNFVCYAVIFLITYFLVTSFTHLTGFWIPVTAAVVASLLAPKFQAVQTSMGEKLFVKWLFFKGVKEL
jgi:uncharacterized membrane protein YvlD (DUF360 family)